MQQEGMVDPQGVGVLLGVQTDVGEGLDSDSTTEQLLNNADSTCISVSPSEKESQKVGLVLPFSANLQHCR